MVLGKKVAILIGKGAEIRPLEMGRKSREFPGHFFAQTTLKTGEVHM